MALPLLPLGAAQWQGVLIALLLANILYIGLVAVAQKELKMMLAYGSVMHMGYLFLGLVAWNALSLGGVVVLMVAHGLSTALLFALAGEVQARTGGEVRMAELGGLAKRMPFIAVTFILGAMAAAGLPGLGKLRGGGPHLLRRVEGAPGRHRPRLLGFRPHAALPRSAPSAPSLFGPLPEKYARRHRPRREPGPLPLHPPGRIAPGDRLRAEPDPGLGEARPRRPPRFPVT